MRIPDADRLPNAEGDDEKTPVDPVPGLGGPRGRFLQNIQAIRAAAASLHEEILKEIAEIEQDFDATVAPLLEKGLAPDTVLWQRINDLFTFTLGKEVGFDAILRTVGRQVHRETALAIERTFANELERFHEFLAVHWAEAGNYGRALQYCLALLQQARRLKDTERVDIFWHRTLKAFEGAIEAYRREGEPREVALLQYRIGLLYQGKGDNEAALTAFLEAQVTYGSAEDKAGISACLSSIGLLKRGMNDAAGAIAAHTQALAIRRELGDKKKIALTLNNLGVAQATHGDLNAAIKTFEEAALAFKDAGDAAGQKLAKQHAAQLKKERKKTAGGRPAEKKEEDKGEKEEKEEKEGGKGEE